MATTVNDIAKPAKEVFIGNEIALANLIGKHYSISIPAGQIPEAGVEEILRFLDENQLPKPPAGEIEWVWETKRGTLPKRLAKWMRKSAKIEPDQAALAALGSLMQRLGAGAADYHFLFHPPPFNWKDGLYGKARSCWWTQGQKEYWEAMNGHAVLFYDGKGWAHANGTGRIWAAEVGVGVLLLINGYLGGDEGKNWTLILTQAVATALGVSYLKVEVASARMHVNSAQGYLVGAPSALAAFSKPLPKGAKQLKIIRLDPPELRRVQCQSCATRLRREEDERHAAGGIYCRECYELNFFPCAKCGGARSREASFIVSGERWCITCFDLHYFTCIGCARDFEVSEMLRVADLAYCPACFKAETFACEDCQLRRPALERQAYRLPPCRLCAHQEEMVVRHLCVACTNRHFEVDPNTLSLI